MKQAFGSDCGEVYSPPRITKMASEMGLHPAWALDLTVVDPDDGIPWDFNVPAKRRRAFELLEREASDADCMPNVWAFQHDE